MGGGNIGHVEWWILTQMDDIHRGKINALRFGKREMVTLDVAQLHLLDGRVNLAIAHGKAVGRVMEQPISTRLRFKAHGEGGITADVDAGDMIHLDRDVLDLRHAHVPLAAYGRLRSAMPCLIFQAFRQDRKRPGNASENLKDVGQRPFKRNCCEPWFL